MRIAQAAELSGLSPRQIRYHQEHGALARSGRTRGKHREFTDGDVRRLRALKILLAAQVPAALAARVLDGVVTGAERTEVERRLDLHVLAGQQTRAALGMTAPESPGAGQPDISLMFDIFVLRTRMGAVLTEALTGAGLTASEYALLSLLREPDPGTVTVLAAQLGIGPAVLGRQLAELVRRDWVVRRAGTARDSTYTLTPTGEQRFAAALPLAARVARELDQGLRQRGKDPDAARAVLQLISATLDTLAPDRSPRPAGPRLARRCEAAVIREEPGRASE